MRTAIASPSGLVAPFPTNHAVTMVRPVQDALAEEEQRKDLKPPRISPREAHRLVREHFDIEEPNLIARVVNVLQLGRSRATQIKQLNSYDDRNFLFYGRYMVKFYNGVESRWPDFIDAQGKAMEHVAAESGLACNRCLLAKDGSNVAYVDLELPSGGGGERKTSRHAMRVLTFVPGDILANVKQTDALLEESGAVIGRVDRALESFAHEGIHRNHFWDLKNTPLLRKFVRHINDEAKRARVLSVLDAFDTKVLPLAGSLRMGAIQNDANDQNVLIDTTVPGGRVQGLIDWGDMVMSWRVCEIAIAMAYVSRGVGDRFVSPPLADAIIVADTDSPICGRPKRPAPHAPHAPIAGTSCSRRMTFCTTPRSCSRDTTGRCLWWNPSGRFFGR